MKRRKVRVEEIRTKDVQMMYYVVKIEKGAYVIGSSMEFVWRESVYPTKAQIIQKAIQHLIKKNAVSGKYSVFYKDEDVVFDFIKREKRA